MTIKINRVLILLALLSVTTKETKSQLNPYNEVTISSPTAASLGKYSDIPVSYHTGVPQISIPIYQISEGSLSLPISLSYHASGLRVGETASWVGAGWSLNAGGVITRTVRGAPDERYTSTTYDQTKGYFSDYGYANYLTFDPPDTSLIDDQAFLEGKKDGEPDLFTYNFGDYSGKFYFRDDRTPIFEPAQDIKVDYVYTGSGSIQSFVMTSPDGDKYFFGKTPETADTDPIEITNPITAQSGYLAGTTTSSWYLNKIKSADNQDSITLNYAREKYSYYSLSMFPVNYSDGTTGAMNFRQPVGGSNFEYNLIKNLVTGVRVSSIIFSNGKVDFIGTNNRTDLGDSILAFTPEYANNMLSKRLDSIKISDNNNNFCKKFVLFYNYFTDNSPLQGYFSSYSITTDSKRLRLDSIQEKSCDNSLSVPPCKFTYFSEPVLRRLSFGQDYWGFINGVTTNTTLIPTYTENEFTVFPGANRRPAWPAMRAGTLKTITYPTGGSSTFIFEPNDTYASTTRYNSTQVFNTYIGYGYSSGYKQEYHTLTGNPYTISLSNGTTGSLSGYLNVYNSSSQLVFSLSANAGQSTQQTVQLGSGTYSVVVSSTNQTTPPSGQGIEAKFFEQVPYTYSRNEMVGGLRIDSIIQNPLAGLKDTTTYTYLDGNNYSTGTLYSRPKFVQVLRSDEIVEAGNGGPFSTDPNPTYTCSQYGCIACDLIGSPPGPLSYYKSSVGIRPMSTSQGNHIGYNEVKVSQNQNGYKIYRYYGSDRWDTNTGEVADTNVNIKPPCDPSIPSFPEAPLQYEPIRGELKYEGNFNQAGRLLKEIYYYLDTTEDKVTTPAIISGHAGSWQVGVYYELKAFRIKYRKTMETDYGSMAGNSSTTTTETYFSSPYHNQPTKKVTYTSTGDSLLTKFKYSADFRTTCDTISDCFSAYQSSYNSVISAWDQQKNYTCPTMGCRYNSYQGFRKDRAKARASYISCRRNNYTDPNSSFNNNFTTKRNAAGTSLKPILDLQLTNSIFPVETSSWKNLSLTSASYTIFDYSINPPTAVYPKKIQKINLSASTSTFTPSSNTNTAVTKDSRYADESTLTFLNGNLSEITNHDGITTTYLWDYFNSKPIAKVTNALNSESAYTSFESNGKGNWSFPGTPDTDYNPITGRMSYDLSNGNVTKNSLSSGTTYIVSYWSRSGAQSVNSGAPTFTDINIKGWVNYKHVISGASIITVSGTGVIDELRLYPSDAQMITYTYDPLSGITSQSSINNTASYYEYDDLGRLKLIRDKNRNVVKRYCYTYAGQAGSCSVDTVTVTLQSSNTLNLSGFTAKYYDAGTSVLVKSFTIPNGSQTLGTLTSGVYKLTISKSSNSTNYLFGSGCNNNQMTTDGTSATFYNITVSPNDCNQISIKSSTGP